MGCLSEMDDWDEISNLDEMGDWFEIVGWVERGSLGKIDSCGKIND